LPRGHQAGIKSSTDPSSTADSLGSEMNGSRLTRVTMHAAGVVAPVVACGALVAPVVRPDIDYDRDYGPEVSHQFTAGTASQLVRPPRGPDSERQLPKAEFRVISMTDPPEYAQAFNVTATE
jgi:hypothetical protein